MSRNIAETLIGAVVLAVAVIFLAFAYQQNTAQTVSGYTISGEFTGVGGLTNGADVRISGIKVGSVLDQTIDPETFMARVTMSIDDKIKLPTDTSARISSEGLLGGSYVALEPGAEERVIEPGGNLVYTQAAADLVSLLTQLVFSQKETPLQ